MGVGLRLLGVRLEEVKLSFINGHFFSMDAWTARQGGVGGGGGWVRVQTTSTYALHMHTLTTMQHHAAEHVIYHN